MLKKILIVDDDEAMADNLEDILDDEGYKICSAHTCTAALELADREQPKVALLDLKLPDDTGINLLGKLKQQHPDCICALMTAYADLDSAVMALEKGAFHYLQKPVRPLELLNLLERIFEIIQIREEKREAENRLIESEKRFRTIFESAQDAIFIKNNNLEYTLVNPAMERFYEKEASEFIGRTDREIFGNRLGRRTAKQDTRVIEGEIIEDEEIHIVGGRQKTYHSIKVPLSGTSPDASGLCGFMRDLTITRQLEAQLLQAQKMEAIGTLAGGISHDFNNLLQAILGYSQILLLNESHSKSDYGKLQEIEKAAQRATELTSQLLAFSRKVEIHPRPLDVNQVVKQVRKLLERTIPKMIEIKLNLDDSVHTVDADPGQLEQVLLNIGVNARDAMPDGGTLTIETANINPDEHFRRINLDEIQNDYVQLSITDTGVGISEEVLEHIFEPFFTTKQTGQGTGLGLAMAYGIVKNHKGHLSCDSVPGMGTTFKIFLPAISVAVEAPPEKIEQPIHRGKGETILVIDDEQILRELAKDMLTFNGYNTITAESGEAGLALYRERIHEVSLVILDLIMPGMGGKQCLAELLSLNPDIKVLIASGYTIDDPATDDILSEAKGFLPKPYNFRNMLQLIRETLSGQKNAAPHVA
jgi:PAS domain S-box-containing protein